ncbi:MAG: alpha/beta hydrolase, partial [Chloroflexi bacterium]|nr:alpha/beta hydrolase [Chloroflexota bacterium]
LARYAGLPAADASVQEKTRKPGGSMARLLRTGVDIRGQRLWPLIREQLPNLRAPTLIIWGERDELFPVSQAREACRLIPNARLYILPKCGHIPGEEDAEKINAVLIDFLLDPKRNA